MYSIIFRFNSSRNNFGVRIATLFTKLCYMANYLLSIANNETLKDGVIHDPHTKLKVKVYNSIESKFKPSKGEVRFFVTAGTKTIAFETKGYKKHAELLILHMISWYCVYLGLLEAQIHANWPMFLIS
jgi:hypothetical protein